MPQVVEVWHNKRHDGISLPTIFTIITTLALWVVYGILKQSISLTVSNIVAIIVIGTVAIGVIRLRKLESSVS